MIHQSADNECLHGRFPDPKSKCRVAAVMMVATLIIMTTAMVVIVSVIGVRRNGMIIVMISLSTSRHRHRHRRLTDFRQRLVSE